MKPETKREQVLRAAEEIFAEKGFDGATMKDIAEGVGVKAPALYNHFASKEDIYNSVISESYVQLQEKVLGPIAKAPDLREKLRLLVDLLVDFWAEHPRLPRIYAQEVLRGSDLVFAELVPNYMAPLFAGIVKALDDKDMEEHGFRRVDMPQLVYNIFGVTIFNFFSGPFFKAIVGRESDTPERNALLKEEIVNLVFHGIERSR